MAIQPILDKVLLKAAKEDGKTKGGIILAGGSKEKPMVADVLARGPGGIIDGKEIKMCVNVGDKVIINKYSGTEINYKNEDYIIVSQRDILAYVD